MELNDYIFHLKAKLVVFFLPIVCFAYSLCHLANRPHGCRVHDPDHLGQSNVRCHVKPLLSQLEAWEVLVYKVAPEMVSND